MSKVISNQIIDILSKAGIKRIYGITGDSVNQLNNAIRENKSIQWIHVRHEENGAFAAGAEAQLTNSLACCAGSSGPGHVHLINGVYDAHRSNAPLLVLATTCMSNEIGMKYFQETNTIKLFDDCSYYNQLACTPVQLIRMTQQAIQNAISKQGVAVVGIPGDIEDNNEQSVNSSDMGYITQPDIYPSEDEIKQMASLINSAKRVTMFCGIGCKKAHEQIINLSKKLNAPVVSTFRGKMYTEYDNENSVGLTGLLGLPSGFQAMHKADLLLMFGTDFPYEGCIPDDINIIQVDIRSSRLGRRAKLTQGICADVANTIDMLLPQVNAKDSVFLKEQLLLHKKMTAMADIYVNDKGTINNISPEYAMSVVDKVCDDDAIFTVDTGMNCVWSARYIHATGKRELIGSMNHGSMGNALPQSMGAAFAFPTRQIVSLCGDGGFSMSLTELATIAQYNLPIKIVIFNNRSLAMVKLEMEIAGLPDWQTDMKNPDFKLVAESFGIKGYDISDPEDVEKIMTEAMSHKGAAVINIKTNPNALSLPTIFSNEFAKNFMESMMKLSTLGRTQEVMDIIKSNEKFLTESFSDKNTKA